MKIEIEVTEEEIRSALELPIRRQVSSTLSHWSVEEDIKRMINDRWPEVEKAMIEEQLTDSEKLKQQICDEILRKLKLQVDRVMRSSSSESEDN